MMRYLIVVVIITVGMGQLEPLITETVVEQPVESPGSHAYPKPGSPLDPNVGSSVGPVDPPLLPTADPHPGSPTHPPSRPPDDTPTSDPYSLPQNRTAGPELRPEFPILPVTTQPQKTLPANATSGTYIVAIPDCIRPGLPFDVFVDILKGENPSTVVVELFNKTTGEVYASVQDIVYKGNPKTLTLQIPDDLSRPWRYEFPYNIRVTGSGEDVTFLNETAVDFDARNVAGFIQTDKPVYKPGDTVHYRIFSLLPDLKIYKGTYDFDIRDPSRNRVQLHLNVTHPSGLIRGSLTLPADSQPGMWTIHASLPGGLTDIFRNFEVSEYVLPRIEVTVTPPPYIYLNQSTVEVDITAKYTFGDDVRGTLLVTLEPLRYGRLCQARVKYHDNPPVLQRTVSGFVGRMTMSFPTADVTALFEERFTFVRTLCLEANITETLTGSVVSGAGSSAIYRTDEKLVNFKSNPRIFKPGLPYTVFVKLSQQDGSPVVGSPEDITVTADFTHQVKHSAEATVLMAPPSVPDAPPTESAFERSPSCSTEDTTQIRVGLRVLQDGILEISLPRVPENADRLQIKSTYKNISQVWQAERLHSPSNSFLQIKLSEENPMPGDIETIQLKTNVDIDSFSLMMLSRGRIAMAHEETRHVKGREFNITFAIRHAMAPRTTVLAYYRTASGEIVADTLDFDVQDPFKTKVSVGFSAEEVQPGDDVTMTVQTAPNSLVATSVVDKKVLLLKTGNDITEKQVTNSLQQFSCFYYDREWGVNGVFKTAGLSVLTDCPLFQRVRPVGRYTPYPGGSEAGYALRYGYGSGGIGGTGGIGGRLQGNFPYSPRSAVNIREEFPDTWLFMVDVTDSSGVLNITTTAPDSITAWEATAFAFNDQDGFGISTEPSKMTVTKPLFAKLFLPYSVIRGEELFLQVNVFNNLRINQTVVVELQGSTSYMSLDIDDAGNEVLVAGARTQTLTVPAGIPKSVIFPIRIAEVGDIPITVTARSAAASDGLTKILRVDPEGVPGEYNFIALVNLTESSPYNTTRAIRYPDRVVEDSQRLGVKLVGDVLGSTLANLANLVRMSYGCGEQNMVNFAPTVFVSRYLETVGQLTGERRADALNFISQAFVAKSLSVAASQGLIVLEVFHLERAYEFILSQQNRFGGFQSTGILHNNRLQGLNGKGDALTAYVLTALMENPPTGMNFSDPIARAQRYVENYVESSTDLYELAIGAYALALAGSSQVDSVLSQLESRAITKDGFTYWEVEREPLYIWEPPRRQTTAASIETTSYVCLVYALRQDIPKMAQCLTYLVGQQNDQGGYVSTQDTVVAIQALSAIAPSFYSQTQSGSLRVEAGGTTASFTVNDANRFELQQATLPVSANNVTVGGSGSGVFLVFLYVSYNVQADLVKPAFDVSANLTRDTPTAIDLTVCARYVIGRTSSMANIEVRLPTDFALTADSKVNLLTTAKRVDVLDGKVILYLDEITNSGICLSLTATGNRNINKPKPNSVKVFDYYNPDKSGLAFYAMRSLDGGFCDAVLCSKDSAGCSANCSKRSRK